MAGAIPAVRSRFRGLGRWRRCRGRFPRKESRFGGRRREIEVRGDDGAGARAPEEKRKKREMTSGSHDLPDKYLGITSGGPSAGRVRTVREAVVTVPLHSIDLHAPPSPHVAVGQGGYGQRASREGCWIGCVPTKAMDVARATTCSCALVVASLLLLLLAPTNPRRYENGTVQI